MTLLPDNPLIVQSDRTLVLHTVRAVVDEEGRPKRAEDGRPLTEEHPRFAAARAAIGAFAELEKSPDYLHTYRITPVSVWNAAALGLTIEEVRERLEEFSCVPIPANVMTDVGTWLGRYGLLRIERSGERFEMVAADAEALEDALGHESVRKSVSLDEDGRAWLDEDQRGPLKQALIRSAIRWTTVAAISRAIRWRFPCGRRRARDPPSACVPTRATLPRRSTARGASGGATVWSCCRAARARPSSGWR